MNDQNKNEVVWQNIKDWLPLILISLGYFVSPIITDSGFLLYGVFELITLFRVKFRNNLPFKVMKFAALAMIFILSVDNIFFNGKNFLFLFVIILLDKIIISKKINLTTQR